MGARIIIECAVFCILILFLSCAFHQLLIISDRFNSLIFSISISPCRRIKKTAQKIILAVKRCVSGRSDVLVGDAMRTLEIGGDALVRS